MRFAILTGLEIKKSIRALPKLLAGAFFMLILVFGIGMLAGGILNEKMQLSEDTKVSVGVVSYDNSKMMDLAKGFLTSTESISEGLNLVFLEEEEAEEGLKQGKYMAVMVIPENAIRDIISGKNTPIEVRFMPNAGYEAAFFKEAADAAVNLLASSQAGIYSVYDFYKENYRANYIDAALERLNTRYIRTVLLREDFFDNTAVVATGELTVAEYYVISGLVLFLFLFGMNSLTYMQEYRRELVVFLEQNGTGAAKQTIAAFAGIVCVYGLVQAALITVAAVAGGMSVGRTAALLLASVPVVCVASSIVLLLHVYVRHKPSAVMLLFLFSLFQSFVTGGFIPQLMLPNAVNAVGAFTPACYMIRQLKLVYMHTYTNAAELVTNTLILLAITFGTLALSGTGMKYYGRDKGRDV